ncbi:MAG: LysR substrate-binding domain-containing protein [Ralstonia sp.]|jgi:DNA-binding transcriptional LysR family regulator|uniref:LysR family transcriptional regulator n=4 Tax=Ralstonia TaxID=48736 RepID=A0A2P4RBV9_RALPI|nr:MULTISPECIES: LysR substrate-binding domain-containing protein [Ralstonia]MEE2978547.1 LysR substrate-binding domain-containing protein [Pseudomonadota bacterium]MBA4200345.1 LysR family transcriptional regulator [Ralstonia sp.]MBA4229435.1 LysR family transcriptional regulator [Ralstonia sp.]MBA4237328.1 LysR family transcriptional regulator [Ralstonia sp.]MBA4400849.1 LysR family transcriptional regulator [Ralstonia sp.]
MKMLDMEAVQAFVLTADLKSFTRAAEAMDSTQSAVSLKIKRLEDALGRRLLERTPRLVRLSQDGAAFLVAARELVAAHEGALGAFGVERRRLSVGISHHIVGAELPRLLRQMGLAEPALTLEIRIASSWEILDIFESGALDAAIVLRHDNRRTDGEVLMEEPFGWMAAPDFEHRAGEPIRLANQADTCRIRQMAVATLEDAGIPWQEVFVGGGVATIGAAAAAGLAVAALSRRVAPPGTVDMGAALGLPPLPPRSVVLHSRLTDSVAKKALRTFASTLRATAGR